MRIWLSRGRGRTFVSRGGPRLTRCSRSEPMSTGSEPGATAPYSVSHRSWCRVPVRLACVRHKTTADSLARLQVGFWQRHLRRSTICGACLLHRAPTSLRGERRRGCLPSFSIRPPSGPSVVAPPGFAACSRSRSRRTRPSAQTSCAPPARVPRPSLSCTTCSWPRSSSPRIRLASSRRYAGSVAPRVLLVITTPSSSRYSSSTLRRRHSFRLAPRRPLRRRRGRLSRYTAYSHQKARSSESAHCEVPNDSKMSGEYCEVSTYM
jgi:hypothetical protein